MISKIQSMHARTTIDREDLSGNPVGVITGKKKCNRRHLLWMAKTQKMLLNDFLGGTRIVILFHQIAYPFGEDRPRGDGIDPDALGGTL